MPDFNEAIRLGPSEAGAYYGRAGVHHDVGDHGAALADLNEAIRLDPVDGSFFFSRGIIFEKTGDLSSALADFRQALKLDPKNDDAAQGVRRIERRDR